MSFDLYFLRPVPGKSWEDLMDDLEGADLEPLDDTDRAQWAAIRAQLADVLPDAENAESEEACELSDPQSGLQLMVAHGEFSLSVPYWYDATTAAPVIELLRKVVTVVESVTGRTAYDPQADAAFLDGGAQHAATSFEQVHRAVRDPTPTAPLPIASPPNQPWWKRIFGK